LSKEKTYIFKNQSSLRNWLAAIDGPFQMAPMGKEIREKSLLDTFDWRMLQSGLMLWRTTSGYRLEREGKDKSLADCANGGISDKVFWWQFPPGEMANRLRKAADVRALLVKLNVRETRTSWRITDPTGRYLGNMVWVERIVVTGDKLLPLAPAVILDSQLEQQIGKDLARTAKPGKLAVYTTEELCQIACIDTKASQRKNRRIQLTADQPAVGACLAVLVELTAQLEMNERGIIDDVDSEFLHEYRVALRKIRALLAQLRRVLPAGKAKHYRREWSRWVRVTNRLRDLDVYLSNEAVYRSSLGKKLRPGLAPLFQHLRIERQKELAMICETLLGDDYKDLKCDWHLFIGQIGFGADHAGKQGGDFILPLVRRLLRRRSRKILRLASTPPKKASDRAFHRLRLQCKKLRYGLELFNSLFPGDRMNDLSTLLKKLQDVLGEYNDLGNQVKELGRQQTELAAAKELSPLTARTIQSLERLLTRRRDKIRKEINTTSRRFCGKKNRTVINALFGGRS